MANYLKMKPAWFAKKNTLLVRLATSSKHLAASTTSSCSMASANVQLRKASSFKNLVIVRPVKTSSGSVKNATLKAF